MRWARGAAVVAVALLSALFGAWLLGWSSNLDPVAAVRGEPAIVEVPDLSGLARPRAVADVESAGLVPVVETRFSLTAPRGAVIGQEPAAGRRLAEGSDVVVVVSRGVTRVEMPEAVGRPLEEVAAPLDEVGVDYEVVELPSETVPEGVVIDQTPEPGRRVTAADTIEFVVSTGPEPREVPDTAGLSPDGAAFALGGSGFAVVVEERDDASAPAGVVMGTEPAAGTVLPRDATVNVIVSAGPPPVAVPDLLGKPQEDALAQLEQVGLVPNVRGGPPSGGTVIGLDPPAATMVRPGSIVSVEVDGG